MISDACEVMINSEAAIYIVTLCCIVAFVIALTGLMIVARVMKSQHQRLRDEKQYERLLSGQQMPHPSCYYDGCRMHGGCLNCKCPSKQSINPA